MLGKVGGLLLISCSASRASVFLPLDRNDRFGRRRPFHPVQPSSIFLSIVQLFMVSGLITLFSAFSTPYLSGLLVFSIYIIGHFLRGIFWNTEKDTKEGLLKTSLPACITFCRTSICFQISNRVIAGSGGRVGRNRVDGCLRDWVWCSLDPRSRPSFRKSGIYSRSLSD